MQHRYEGVDASELKDQDLRKELRSLHRTREDTFLNGSKQSLEEHTERMMDLEREFLRRFPKEAQPAAQRTRVGARTGRAPSGTKRKPQRSTTRS